ncbi:MAG: glycosyltransferase family 2 protein [Planctomycetes bacterium]|nr:glycosyltransferase family 2 protein [Planctomycetota bacterium]
MTQPISVTIICFNEEDNIRRCLESVKWVKESGGEIVVVDSFSMDRTVAICKEYTDKVFQNKWPGFVNQKNHALGLAANDWVLSLDADEVLTDEARTEIRREWANKQYEKYDGYYIKRHTFYLGRWINHGGWYPDYKLRLFRKSKGKWGGDDPHDRVIMAEGTTIKRLEGELVHHTYKNIAYQLRTIDKFSDAAGESLRAKGNGFSLLNLFFRPPAKFIETYLWKAGFLDGLAGLIIAVLSSYYVFIKYAKMWEKETTDKH